MLRTLLNKLGVKKCAHFKRFNRFAGTACCSLISAAQTADAAGARLCGCHCGSTVEPAAAARSVASAPPEHSGQYALCHTRFGYSKYQTISLGQYKMYLLSFTELVYNKDKHLTLCQPHRWDSGEILQRTVGLGKIVLKDI